jgi:hypothetical protein
LARKRWANIYQLCQSGRSQKNQKNQEDKEKNCLSVLRGFPRSFLIFPRPQYTSVSGEILCASILRDFGSVVKNSEKS